MYPERVRIACCIVAALALPLVPAAAHADRVGLVILEVADMPASPEELSAALSAAAKGEVVGDPFGEAAAALADDAVPRSRLESFAAAKSLAREGWRAFLSVEPERAEELLSSARGRAVEALDVPGGVEHLADVALRLGAVRLALGQDEAHPELALAHALDPGREVTTAAFSPEVVEAYEEAAARQRDAEPVEISIESAPAGAEVEIDGEVVGEAPLSAAVAPGLVAVVGRAPGHRAAARLVQMPASDGEDFEGEPKIELVLERDPAAAAILIGARALAVGADEELAAEAVEGLQIYAELDGVLVAAAVWSRGEPALLGQLCGGAAARCGRPVEIGYPRPGDLEAAARKLWEAAGEAKGIRPPTLQVDPRILGAEAAPTAPLVRRAPAPESPGASQPWWGSPWLWGGVGAAAVGIAAAILVTSPGERSLEVEIPACEFGGC